MKQLTYLLLLPLLLLTGCDDEDTLVPLEDVAAPTALSLDFAVAPDNSGRVTITPGGAGVTAFTVGFGDGAEDSEPLAPGESIDHVYELGTYAVTLTGQGINGLTATVTRELTVDFAAPENLMVTVTPVPGAPLSVEVTATADLENDFAAYFGEDAGAEPLLFTEGETVTYTYAGVGTYDIRVVARSGGSATIEETVSITIANPLVLPIDFEDGSRDYGLIGFGGAAVGLVANPDPDATNGSGTVAELLKTNGSEVWAGAFFELGESLDFGRGRQITVSVWSPRAGVPVILKLENAADADLFIEDTQTTTVANAWETLTFNLAGDLTQSYSKVVFFADFGTPGQGETFYFDDFRQVDGSPRIAFPLTFEESELTFTFNNFGGANAEVVDNPDQGAGNPSGRVVRFAKNPNSEVWGGVFIDTDAPLDFSNGQTITLKVWSPTVGSNILLKLENPADSDINQEVSVTTTTSGEWETLTYDFSGIQNLSGIQRVVLFANFGNSGTNGDYFFDDFVLQ